MRLALICALLLSFLATALDAQVDPTANDLLVIKIIAREHQVTRELEGFHPIVETYVQVMKSEQGTLVPSYDRHFISLAEFSGGLHAIRFKHANSEVARDVNELFDSFKPTTMEYNPGGFVAMAYPEPSTFDLRHYRFQYLTKEPVDDRLCLVFQVSPSATRKSGLFEGKIWVEDHDLTIVRFEGRFAGTNIARKYVHFDSRRVQSPSGSWLPGVIYSGERELPCCGIGKLNWTKIHFQAETRFWGYDPRPSVSHAELVRTVIDAPNGVRDFANSESDRSPIDQQALWYRQAETNVTDQLERIGLLAPRGEVERTLEVILNKIQTANALSTEPEVRCRILLTSNLESAVVDHTIILSRGLLDTLPDEATLAAVLADNLAHVTLDHRIDGRFSWTDQVRFDATEVMRKLRFAHSAQEEARASALAQEWMSQSPYRLSLNLVAQFAAELQARSPHIQQLLKAGIGDSLSATLAAYHRNSPEPFAGQVSKSNAIPLGSRIKLNPWTNETAFAAPRPRDAPSVAENLVQEVAVTGVGRNF